MLGDLVGAGVAVLGELEEGGVAAGQHRATHETLQQELHMQDEAGVVGTLDVEAHTEGLLDDLHDVLHPAKQQRGRAVRLVARGVEQVHREEDGLFGGQLPVEARGDGGGHVLGGRKLLRVEHAQFGHGCRRDPHAFVEPLDHVGDVVDDGDREAPPEIAPEAALRLVDRPGRRLDDRIRHVRQQSSFALAVGAVVEDERLLDLGRVEYIIGLQPEREAPSHQHALAPRLVDGDDDIVVEHLVHRDGVRRRGAPSGCRGVGGAHAEKSRSREREFSPSGVSRMPAPVREPAAHPGGLGTLES